MSMSNPIQLSSYNLQFLKFCSNNCIILYTYKYSHCSIVDHVAATPFSPGDGDSIEVKALIFSVSVVVTMVQFLASAGEAPVLRKGPIARC